MRLSLDDEEYPKVLLLSDEGPQMSTAGGILLYRLLRGYPSGRLSVIERNPDPKQTQLPCRYARLTVPWRRFEGSRLNRWKRSLRAFHLTPEVEARRIDALLDGFEAEVCLSVMQHAAYYDCAYRFARHHDLPLVIIVHDVNEQFEPVFDWARAAARRRDGQVYRYATRRLCVSPEMEQLCAELYGVRGEVLYPNRSEELEPRDIGETRTLKEPGRLTVGFVGNLNYGYGDELVRLLPAFRKAAARVVIFSGLPGGGAAALLAATDCIDYRGFVPAMDAWRSVQRECDAVILPYPNPAGPLERLYRHHFPSKLPEYLALGLPVIVTGPSYATGVKWALRNADAAQSWTETDPNEFAQVLTVLREDASRRTELAEHGFAAGERDFEPRRIRAEFLRHICESVGSRVDGGEGR